MKIQIAVALIAFPLLRMAQAGQKAIATFARLVRANLLHRRPLDPQPPPIRNPAQMMLHRNPT